MFAPEGFEISRSHREELERVHSAEREERQAQEAREEAAAYRSIMIDPRLREEYDLALAREMSRARQAEQAELRAAAERQARCEDYRTMLLATGQGEWRTVEEILNAQRGVMP